MMKMNPRSAILKENHTSAEIQSSSPSQLKNRSANRKHKNLKENVTPCDANAIPDLNPSPCKPSPAAAKLKNPLPPRPPISNPLKRKLITDPVHEIGVSDSGVKVIVRVRPPNKEEEEGEVVVQKSADDSLSVLGHSFTFDSVADAESSQMDIFQLVGAPLVENCLAGFNSSVFAYGQTGSGKTYTIWGPANALLEKNIYSDQHGLTPRVFERLFSRIDEEQKKHADKQLIYQCRCSFLEIYNEQITDLLEPTQRNLQIREDVKTGVYVENLTEECVNSMKDVMQLLIKGLSHRRIGATSINVESSRSHSVFTCVVESLHKRVADGLSCCKTSRINLVDLAGSERQKLTGAAGERLKEAGNINRSLSQLGNLINILAEVSQTGKQRHIPYRDSKLTFLLQESLGGNAKLAMVCAISPALSCKSETLSTLRFAQRAKAIKNKAVINEQMQDDVAVLREVIRQLKDELLLMKANGMQADPSGGSSGWNARRSLNLLKFSLNRPMVLPRIDDDGDEEMEIVEEVDNEDNEEKRMSQCVCTDDTDVNMEEDIVNHCTEEIGSKDESFNQSFDRTHSEDTSQKPSEEGLPSISNLLNRETLKMAANESLNCPSSGTENIGSGENPAPSLAIVPSDVSPTLKNPVPSVSPIVNGSSRKSLRTSTMLTASQKDLATSNLSSEDVHVSGARTSKGIGLMSAQGKNRFGPTDHLAASLHRGLEIIDSHRQSSALRQSSFRFSYKPVDIQPVFVRKDVGVQTLFQDTALIEEESPVFLCSNCKCRTDQEVKVEDDSLNMQLVPVDGPHSADKSKKLVPRAVEKVLAGAIRREMALEEYCSRQAYEIMQLNRLVQQYKHERECSAIIGQTQEDKIIRLDSLMDGILSTEEFKDDELASMKNENKILKEKYENHPELLRMEIELKRVQDELERYRNFFDMGEKDVLLEEIQDLKRQLQFYIDSSPKSSRKRSPMLQLTYSCDPTMAPPLLTIPESMKDSAEEKIEKERVRWTEAESKWISLAEELRSELEASRTLAEKQKLELDMEKKCSEELKEAMQMAMEGHARMLEQYADLEEKHIQLLTRQRRIQDGVEDIKKAASRAGVRGAESKFINALAAEISILKMEREKERRQFRDERKGLQTQLRNTAEAVQAAGELLVRLKEAEEAVAASKKRARDAGQETEKAYKQIEKLKRKHENEITTFHQLLAEAHAQLPNETSHLAYNAPDVPKYDAEEPSSMSDQRWREEFEPFYNVPQEPSFFGYDRCNV